MNIRVVFCVIVCGLVLAFVGRAGGDPPGQGHSQRVFKVGVLASLTGSWSSLGKTPLPRCRLPKSKSKQKRLTNTADIGFSFLFATRNSIRHRRSTPSRSSTGAE